MASSLAVVLAFTGCVLVPTTSGAAAPVDEQAREQRRPKTQQMASVPVTEVGYEPGLKPTTAADTESITWPAAGTADVTLATGSASANAATVPGAVKAGKLPVRVGGSRTAQAAGARAGTAKPGTPGKVRIRVGTRAEAKKAGVDGVLMQVTRADGAAGAGQVGLEVDYRSFADAYGGDWASRLRLVQLPDCALTTPEKAECRTATPLATRNDEVKKTLVADVPAPTTATARSGASALSAAATSGVLAVSGGASGSNGTYAATSLLPSGSWQATGNTGGFSWQYPLRVPPALAGPSPQLALAYSSSSVDGRTNSANSQTSWVGEGFDLNVGFIERSYKSCEDDGHDDLGEQKYDLCWASDNATMAFGSRNGELVKKGDGTWRLKSDDGTKIERKTGGFNDDNNDEYWLVTTPDGTRYHFGKGKRTAADTENTNSSWEVPVYGDDSGEPCHQDSFADSRCKQTWRWNLDYVVDAHGNSMTYYWQQETNRYGANRDDESVAYDRGGYLKRIEYGEREGSENSTTAPAQVKFTVAERCDGAATDCEPGDLDDDTAHRWPDVPQDLICTDTDSCEDQWSPAFFSRKRLTAVTTQVLNTSGALIDVDVWNLEQSYPDAGDGSTDSLWLDAITHIGKGAGSSITLPKTTFSWVQLPNRVDKDGDDRLPYNKMRMRAIQSESGGLISINYRQAECTLDNLPNPATNSKACFPSFWSKEGTIGEGEDWFHKHLVETVVEDDRTGNGEDKLTTYQYLDGAAWHYDDNEIAKSENKTWSQFRGYKTVRTIVGKPGITQLRTEQTYLRGMDGDRETEDGGKKSVTVTATNGTAVRDDDRYQGFVIESRTFNGVGGGEVSASINTPWLSAPTATEGNDDARLMGIAKTVTRTALDGGAMRRTQVTHSYDATYGMVTTSSDSGDLAKADDDNCTTYTYARNTGKNLLTLLQRVETVAKPCGQPVSYPDDAISDVRTWYDGNDYGKTPDKGDVTRSEKVVGYSNGTPQYEKQSRSEYDAYGRVTASYDAKENRTQTSYIPASGGPVTGMKVTDPAGHSVTSTVDPAWGLVTATVDANQQRTDQVYDALGRLIKVWLPGRPKATQPIPSLEYTYLVRTDGPVVVTTKKLLPNGGQQASYELYDGLLRPRQQQAPTPNTGRIVTDTVYDSRGLVTRNVGPYYNSSAPGGDRLVDTSESADGVPPETQTVYDGVGRATTEIFTVAGKEKWRTATSYHGDHTNHTPAAGGTPTTAYTDVQGRTVRILGYHGTTPTGPADTTWYEYAKAGQLSKVTDPAGNIWEYRYDLRGRQVWASDPDTGTSTASYNSLDQVTSTTDHRTRTMSYTYDVLGRVKTTSEGATPLTSYEYDTAVNGKGRLAAAHRHVGAAKYTTAVASYDLGGRPTKQTVTIPAVENKLAGTYTFEAGYYPDGSTDYTKIPAAGGLSAETVYSGYNAFGLPSFTLGTSNYVRESRYSNLSEPLQYSLGLSSSSKYTWLTYAYEKGTQRLENARVDREIVADPDTDATYAYDATGNILKIADTPKNRTPDVQCFQYDYLRRLTEAWAQTSTTCAAAPAQAVIGGAAPYWQSFTYDVAGNRTSEVNHAVTTGGTEVRKTYTMNGVGAMQATTPAPAHGVKRVDIATVTGTSTVSTAQTFEYDKSGNSTRRMLSSTVDQSLTWDAEGHVSEIVQGGKKSSFLYDASGQRLIRRDDATKSVTLYLGPMEIRLDTTNTDVTKQTLTATRYYSHGGQTVAVRTNSGVSWLGGGQNGTAEISINASTSAVTQRRTLPFGDVRGAKPAWPGEQSFVGGTSDPTTSLIHLGAREYDPVSGRFLSVDPIRDFSDPQQLNGFAYGRNNPFGFPDPSGLNWGWSEWGHLGLDVVGLVPLVGEIADGINGTWYLAEGDYANAALSYTSMVPLYGYGASVVKGGKYIDEAFDATEAVAATTKSADNVADATKAADNVTPPVAPKEKPAPKPDEPATPKTPDGPAKPKTDQKPEASGKPTKKNDDCHSFDPATRVLLANGTTKAIGDLKPGDEVLASDPETGAVETREVEATHINLDTELTDLTIRVNEDGQKEGSGSSASVEEVLYTTQNHPFYSQTKRQWINAADLQIGEQLRTSDDDIAVVEAVRNFTSSKVMRDLTVEEFHTYYVLTGDTPILVHNCGEEDDFRIEDHVEPRHVAGGDENVEGKSTFAPRLSNRAALLDLASNSKRFIGRVQKETGNIRWTIDTGKNMGVDEFGLPTTLLTIIRRPAGGWDAGNLVTMHPGLPRDMSRPFAQ
jgi:RHS repeat-associated protein